MSRTTPFDDTANETVAIARKVDPVSASHASVHNGQNNCDPKVDQSDAQICGHIVSDGRDKRNTEKYKKMS